MIKVISLGRTQQLDTDQKVNKNISIVQACVVQVAQAFSKFRGKMFFSPDLLERRV